MKASAAEIVRSVVRGELKRGGAPSDLKRITHRCMRSLQPWEREVILFEALIMAIGDELGRPVSIDERSPDLSVHVIPAGLPGLGKRR